MKKNDGNIPLFWDMRKILRIMKLTTVLLFVLSAYSFATSYGQNVKINMARENASVKDVIEQLEKESGYYVVIKYDQNILDRKIEANFKDASVSDVLDVLLKDTGFGYTFIDKYIAISSLNEMKPLAQQKVAGKVIDATNGDPIIGANVIIEGTTIGTVTDTEGAFNIEVPRAGTVLVVSFLGFNPERVVINGQSLVEIKLVPDITKLEEIVVVGYGIQKKESITSSVASVKGKELNQSPSANISNMMVGRISGITAIQDQGSPGDDQSRIYVRGLSTTGNNTPLYVIDGVPRESMDFQRLAPTEIDNVSVLKDAAAAAVYGARGANGVILVTTKRGASQQPSFSYSFNYGLQKATRLPDYLDSYGYADLYNKALANEGRAPVYSAEALEKYKNGSDPIFYPNTDWLSILEDAAPMQQHNLSVSGGNEKVKYYLSFNYLNQKSIVGNDYGFTRYNFRSNIDVQVTKTTKLALDVSGYLGKREEPASGYGFNDLFRTPPTFAGKYPNGMWGPGYSNRNPWANILESGYQHIQNDGLLSRLELLQNVTFIKGLSLKGMLAFDYKPSQSKTWNLPVKIYNAVKDGSNVRYDQVGGFSKPTLNDYMGLGKNLVAEAHIIYNRSFDKHNIGGLLLYSQQNTDYIDLGATRRDFLSTQLDIINAGGAANKDNSGSANQYHRQSVVGRLTYNYDLRYMVEFDARYDGSDLFAKGKRFGFFPAASVGWLVSKEQFMQDLSFIDNFKIRASYGTLGNDQISQYQYLPFYTYGNGVSMGDGSDYQDNIYLSRLQNVDVTWEKSKKTDIGFEATLLKNFNIEADFFSEQRDDILGKRSATIPDYIGVPESQLPYENFQRVDNKGIELAIGYRKEFQNGLSIQNRFNYTHTKNTVKFIGEPANKPDRIREEGRPLYSRFGYNALGLFQSQEEITKAYGTNHPEVKPGDIYYEDLNGDKKIDGEDITYIGASNLPVNIYGLNSSVNFKGVEFSMFWQAGTGNQQYFATWMAQPFEQAGKALTAHLDYWRPDNTGAAYPRVTTTSAWNNGNYSSFWLRNMKYLRLKNIELAYSLPKVMIEKMRMQNFRVYFNASNLLTFSPYKEVDPENTSYYGTIYPQQVVYNFGVQVSF